MSLFESIKEDILRVAGQNDPVAVAIYCREALQTAVKFIYENAGEQFPASASLLELLDDGFFDSFVGDAEILGSLHYIRILGSNASHGKTIRKSEAKLALDNLSFFIGFTEAKLNPASLNGHCLKLPFMSEAATRRLYIDLYLREAGWNVMQKENLLMPSTAGIEMQVEGMPNTEGIGFCDYVLYGKDGKPLAVIEVKRTSVSPESGRQQVILYGECLKRKYAMTPILYYTNGYTIRCMDGLYPDRTLFAFHTQSELELLLQRRGRRDITNLQFNENIADRPYQKMAITNLCERLNQRYRRGLLVMATGTGKTRVAISLVDVLARNQWIKNMLFLADRTSLVAQAYNNFKNLLPDQSYCVLSDSGLGKNLNARVMFSTYQTMINYVDGEDKKFSTGRFDLIVVDEAHRSLFNKYRSIFSYFDSLLIGLTATPKSEVDANTYRIFDCESGMPSFDYSLQEAVKEHYLIPYKVVNRTTRFMTRGIKYDELSPEEKAQIEEAFSGTPLGIGFDISEDALFKKVYNEGTCDCVLQELMEMGLKIESGDKLGKTIIFAYNHKHAQMLVERFHALYPHLGANFCQLIDNYVNYADTLIPQFEDRPDFQIAVSVDMLDTGIDVPAVLNLVFFKKVFSKIKFVQMIGRGTRLCKDIFGPGKDKERFLIFDYCSNFEFFGENPDTVEAKETLSITQRLFKIRLGILLELQKIEHQKIKFNRHYHLKLLGMLHNEIVTIRSHHNRIRIREKMQYVDKYNQRELWFGLSPVMQKEIEYHLAPLLDADATEAEPVKIFDARMLNVEISMLLKGNIGKAKGDVRIIREVCQYLLNKAAIPQIMAKASQLQTLASEQFWMTPTLERLESLREDVRDLMRFLENEGKIQVVIDIDDETGDGGELDVSGDLIDIRTYRQKVIDFLAENSNSPVLQKIRNLEKIDVNDLKALEHILWHQLGTREEYQESADTDNLAVFVRSLIGLEQEAINSKFGQFLNGNLLTAQQQEFVKSIIDYVRENGTISKEDLCQKSPFNNFDLTSLFGENLPILLHVVNTMQNTVTAA